MGVESRAKIAMSRLHWRAVWGNTRRFVHLGQGPDGNVPSVLRDFNFAECWEVTRRISTQENQQQNWDQNLSMTFKSMMSRLRKMLVIFCLSKMAMAVLAMRKCKYFQTRLTTLSMTIPICHQALNLQIWNSHLLLLYRATWSSLEAEWARVKLESKILEMSKNSRTWQPCLSSGGQKLCKDRKMLWNQPMVFFADMKYFTYYVFFLLLAPLHSFPFSFASFTITLFAQSHIA